MVKKRGREGARAGVWRVTKNILVFYALLDAVFFAYTTCYTTGSRALCSY